MFLPDNLVFLGEGVTLIYAPAQCSHNFTVDKRSDISAKTGNFTNQAGGYVSILFRRGEKHGFDTGREITVHTGQLEFILEVGDGAQPAQNDTRLLLDHEIHQQVVKAADFDIPYVCQHFPRQRHAGFEGKGSALVRTRCNRHQHTVEQSRSPLDQVRVAIGYGIEGSRIYDGIHAPLWRIDNSADKTGAETAPLTASSPVSETTSVHPIAPGKVIADLTCHLAAQ